VDSAGKYLKPAEVANLLRVKVSSVYQWTSAGKLPFVRISRCKILIDVAELQAWLDARKVPAISVGGNKAGDSCK